MCFCYVISKITIEIIKIIPIFVVGCITAYIAYQQMQTNRMKLKHDLFDRRFQIFDAVKSFIGQVTSSPIGAFQKVIELNHFTGSAVFLFGSEIVAYIEEAKRRAIQMESFSKKDAQHRGESDNDENMDNELWFTNQISDNILINKFQKYLTLKGMS